MIDSQDDTTVQATFDSTERPSEAVVRTVAAATDRDVLSLDPLQWAVDTDALNALVQEGRDDVDLTFTYADCRVSLTDQTIEVRPTDDEA